MIGDEMGLGKTIQAIAAAEILSRNFGDEGAGDLSDVAQVSVAK